MLLPTDRQTDSPVLSGSAESSTQFIIYKSTTNEKFLQWPVKDGRTDGRTAARLHIQFGS
jgi:hypothetical protein